MKDNDPDIGTFCYCKIENGYFIPISYVPEIMRVDGDMKWVGDRWLIIESTIISAMFGTSRMFVYRRDKGWGCIGRYRGIDNKKFKVSIDEIED